MESLEELVNKIAKHHHENPSHGITCSCMDAYIRHVRAALKCNDPDVQRRVNYVFYAVVSR